MDCAISSNLLEQYICHANDVVELKLIRREQDIADDSCIFRPVYSHQFFGDSENIFGYKDLHIKMYYTARNLKLYFAIDFSEKIDPKLSGGVKADDVLQIIGEKLELSGQTSSIDQLSNWLAKENTFQPYGQKIHSFETDENFDIELKQQANGKQTDDKDAVTSSTKSNNVNGCTSYGKAQGELRKFEIYHANADVKGFINDFHEQMQHFLLWFIDGASYIDIDDNKWDYFVLYEKVQDDSGEQKDQFYFAGYATVYRYYAYPENARPRISQILILPPFQRRNLGVHLLRSIYNYYVCDPKVIDITVEDPSDNFAQLRNYVDCANCAQLPTFQPDKLKVGWSKAMADEARQRFRINARQARKVYEILKLRATNQNDSNEYKAYRLEVKRRLAAPLMKNHKSTKFFGNKLNQDRTPREIIIEGLSIVYKDLEKEYLSTIHRLNFTGH